MGIILLFIYMNISYQLDDSYEPQPDFNITVEVRLLDGDIEIDPSSIAFHDWIVTEDILLPAPSMQCGFNETSREEFLSTTTKPAASKKSNSLDTSTSRVTESREGLDVHPQEKINVLRHELIKEISLHVCLEFPIDTAILAAVCISTEE